MVNEDVIDCVYNNTICENVMGFAISLSFSSSLICQESEMYMFLWENFDEYLMVLFNCGSYLSSCELSDRILLYYG
jgi:hypothetical protein